MVPAALRDAKWRYGNGFEDGIGSLIEEFRAQGL